MREFVLSDESINCYGSRVLTAGIQLKWFKKNPAMFWNHHRSDDWTGNTNILPIGKWEKLRVDKGKLIGTPDLDENDPFAASIKSKVENGYINATSIGIDVIEVSTDPKLMLKGQTRPTITKSVLKEVSMVDLPANPNAVKLSGKDGATLLLLSNGKPVENLNDILPLIENPLNDNINLSMENQDKETKKGILQGFADFFSNAAKTGEFDKEKLDKLNADYTQLKSENETYQTEITTLKSENEALKTKAAGLQTQLNEANTAKEDAESKATEAEAAKVVAEEKATKAEAAKEVAETKITEVEAEKKAAETEATEAKEKIDKIIKDNKLEPEEVEQANPIQNEGGGDESEEEVLSADDNAYALLHNVMAGESSE